jgi:hypothetical protein
MGRNCDGEIGFLGGDRGIVDMREKSGTIDVDELFIDREDELGFCGTATLGYHFSNSPSPCMLSLRSPR